MPERDTSQTSNCQEQPIRPGEGDLHPALRQDTVAAGEWQLCRVRLMDDRRFPWLILVPRRPGASEVLDLDAPERAVLIEEIARASAALRQVCRCDKLNVGALGNMVPQLHVHVVARTRDDPAWPGPVWGSGPRLPYDEAGRGDLLARLSAAFGSTR